MEADRPLGQKLKSLVPTLLIGQMISVLLTGTSIFSGLLSQNHRVNLPSFLSWCNSVLLMVSFGFLYWRKLRSSDAEYVQLEEGNTRRFDRWVLLKYLILGLCDLEGNTLLILAYRYTSIVSVMFLDAFALPCVYFFGYLLHRYSAYGGLGGYNGKNVKWKLFGVALCLLGLTLLVYEDHRTGRFGDNEDTSKWWLGDMLALTGAILYAVSNVMQEHLIQTRQNPHETLMMMGLVGTVVGGVQWLVFEINVLIAIEWSYTIAGLMVGFCLCLFSLYTLTPHLLKRRNGAMMLNLSVLSSDFYGVVLSYLILKNQVMLTWGYGVAFSGVLVGVGVYAWWT
jgi:solute carrier family 35 protein F1/2